MIEKGSVRPPRRSPSRTYWPIAKDSDDRAEVLAAGLPDGEKALPVFGYAEEAELFLWLGGSTSGPSGLGIADTVAAELVRSSCYVEVLVERLAVDRAQIDEWDMPTRPAKAADSRAARFTRERGTAP